MDTGQTILISSQLIFGALAVFMAIMLWSKIRGSTADGIVWTMIFFGVIVAYIETLYSVLKIFGITGNELIIFGSIPLAALVLPVIRMSFFITAFAIMIYKQSRLK